MALPLASGEAPVPLRRPDMAEGCRERLDRAFLRWVWQYPTARRPALLARLQELGEQKRVIILRSPREVCDFLASLGSV